MNGLLRYRLSVANLLSSKYAVVVLIPFATLAFYLTLWEFLDNGYDWDLDHELYFGKELLSGRLIWTTEFHDKLPLVQYFFSLPAALGGIQTWKLVSLIVSLFFLVAASYLLVRLRKPQSAAFPGGRACVVLAAAVSLALSMILPGGITHINAIPAYASFFAVVAYWFVAETRLVGSKRFVLLGAAVIAAVVSVSFRPYLLVPLLLVLLLPNRWLVSRPSPDLRSQNSVKIGIVVSVALLGIVANFAPYALSDSAGAVLQGLRTLLAVENPDSTLVSMVNEYERGGLRAVVVVALVLAIVAQTVALVLSAKQPDGQNFSHVVIPVFTLGLAVTLLSQHWWPHYTNLFTPFLVFPSVALLAMLFELLKLRLSRNRLYRLRTLGGLLSWVFVIGLGLANSVQTGPQIQTQVNKDFETVILGLEREGLITNGFLAPENMFVHYRFGESRLGFPHAANTQQIEAGWWSSVNRGAWFSAPRSLEEYCELLDARHPSVLVLSSMSPINRCVFPLAANDYYLETNNSISENLRVYVSSRPAS